MATSPASLTLVRGNSAAWPLQAYTVAGPAAVGLFDGTETLVAKVFYGDDAALTIVPTAGWIDGPSGQYLVSIAVPQSLQLAAGQYTLVVTAARTSTVVATLLEVTLIVEPAPSDGLDGTLRSLAQPGDFLSLVPEQTTNPAVAMALEAATRAIEALCRRPLVLGSYDRCFRPGPTRKIYLPAWPVQALSGLTTDLRVVATLGNTDTANQDATVAMTAASAGSQCPATLVLTRTASGVATADTLTLADYPTIADLLAAVTATGGGWTADPGGAGSLLLLSPARLNFAMGTFGALDERVELTAYVTRINGFVLHGETGEIELDRSHAEAFRYPDRAFDGAWGGGNQALHANVRAQWRGGYATAQADLALGYEEVPSDLKAACCLTAQAILSAGPLAGVIKSQSSGTRKYVLRDDATTVPMAARPLLARYINHRFGGWGE